MSCVSLPGPIAARVDAIAKQRGQSRRRVVVDLLRQVLDCDCNLAPGGA